MRSVWEWHPERFTRGYADRPEESRAKDLPYSLLVLNVPIQDRNHFMNLGRLSSWRACADGGANRVMDLLGNDSMSFDLHLICGDMDSIRQEVLDAFTDTKIVRDNDQYSTDLTKTLRQLGSVHESAFRHALSRHESIDVAIFGGLEGRADQALSQLHQLYASSRTKPGGVGDLYLVTASSVLILLEKGLNRIRTPVAAGCFTEMAGIVPLARPARLTTRGFEWNLDNEEMEFGQFISTSNHIMRGVVEVETSEPVIFTLELG